MRKGTKKVFPKDYERLVATAKEAVECEALPLTLQLDDVDNYTLNDFEDTLYDFRKDTGIDMTGHFYFCDDCQQMHLVLEIDYPEQEEGTILQ